MAMEVIMMGGIRVPALVVAKNPWVPKMGGGIPVGHPKMEW